MDSPSPHPISIRYIIPNLMTLMGLCAGLTALRLLLDGKVEGAAILILVAAIIDGLDGRVARYLKGTSRFGAELDSLADFVNFGVVPALGLYIWMLGQTGSLGWACVLLYTAACGLRLARFNVMDISSASGGGTQSLKPSSTFTGVPAPAGALLALFPLFLFLAGVEQIREYGPLCSFYLLCVGGAMISKTPTFSLKHLKIQRESFLLVLLGGVFVGALLIAFPWVMISSIIFLYLIYIFIVMSKNLVYSVYYVMGKKYK